MKRGDREYQICKVVAQYMRLQYPKIPFRFDQAGYKLSIAQAGKNKAIQYCKGWPDLFIAEKRGDFFNGCFIEVKKEGTRLFKRNGEPADIHIAEQRDCLDKLTKQGYFSCFGVGLDNCIEIIDKYLNY